MISKLLGCVSRYDVLEHYTMLDAWEVVSMCTHVSCIVVLRLWSGSTRVGEGIRGLILILLLLLEMQVLCNGFHIWGKFLLGASILFLGRLLGHETEVGGNDSGVPDEAHTNATLPLL